MTDQRHVPPLSSATMVGVSPLHSFFSLFAPVSTSSSIPSSDEPTRTMTSTTTMSSNDIFDIDGSGGADGLQSSRLWISSKNEYRSSSSILYELDSSLTQPNIVPGLSSTSAVVSHQGQVLPCQGGGSALTGGITGVTGSWSATIAARQCEAISFFARSHLLPT
jgi:hypothetical protein